ncbi:hypothetical protein NARC_50114 [Candidatus Nitrosocosmicus arcticus]|uniref:Uncharacterized protein n=1 Tax=Candidatus Nitrosocosmicus arcticus TaxID=2035267 RepID=A0A557SWG0_9ARCH|nr:hypothetical protein NARC_50114 [Candidatus Nitrosocosmicus arcticus]
MLICEYDSTIAVQLDDLVEGHVLLDGILESVVDIQIFTIIIYIHHFKKHKKKRITSYKSERCNYSYCCLRLLIPQFSTSHPSLLLYI